MAGRGVCFDTGGLNIKSAASNIADMKDDMGALLQYSELCMQSQSKNLMLGL